MSRRNGSGPKLDLKLNLSPPRANPLADSPRRSATESPTSPPSSCVSSELNQDDSSLRYSNSPEATSMVLVGCPRCLMYVMLSEEDPKCPKCKSTVLLDFLHENSNPTIKTRKCQTTTPLFPLFSLSALTITFLYMFCQTLSFLFLLPPGGSAICAPFFCFVPAIFTFKQGITSLSVRKD